MLDRDRGRGHDGGGSSMATQYAKGCNSDRKPYIANIRKSWLNVRINYNVSTVCSATSIGQCKPENPDQLHNVQCWLCGRQT